MGPTSIILPFRLSTRIFLRVLGTTIVYVPTLPTTIPTFFETGVRIVPYVPTRTSMEGTIIR